MKFLFIILSLIMASCGSEDKAAPVAKEKTGPDPIKNISQAESCPLYSAPKVKEKPTKKNAHSEKTRISNPLENFFEEFDIKSLPQSWVDDAPKTTKDILKLYPPKSKISIDGQEFYFSDIYTVSSSERPELVVYSHDQNKTFPRLFYKSNSDGGYRSAPSFLLGKYSKGKEWHYTQETKPVVPIILHLGHKEEREKILPHPVFPGDSSSSISIRFGPAIGSEIYTYDDEVSLVKVQGIEELRDCQPGKCFNELSFDQIVKLFSKFIPKEEETKKFFPDLNQKVFYSYQWQHTLLPGKITTEVFLASLNDEPIEWHFARDEDGRVWVDRINFSKDKINSYGVNRRVIDSGALTNKPLEYFEQSNKLIGQWDFEESVEKYLDITPLLDCFFIIKDYRKARAIIRTTKTKSICP